MSVTEQKNITAQRKGHKAYATTIMNEVEALSNDYSQEDKVKIITYSQVLTERSQTIQSFDNRIMETLTEDQEIENEVMTSSDYHMRLQGALVTLADALQKLADKDDNHTAIPYRTMSHDNAKLPKFQLKSFSGEVLYFQEF